MRLLDKERVPYILSKTQLRTVRPNYKKRESFGSPFYIEFSNAWENGLRSVKLRMRNTPISYYCNVVIDSVEHSIGCRQFSRSNFSKIMRAMRAAKPKTKRRAR